MSMKDHGMLDASKLKYFQFVLVHALLTLYQPSEMTLYVHGA